MPETSALAAIEDASRSLAGSEQARISNDAQRLDQARQCADRAIAALERHVQSRKEGAQVRRLLARAWKLRGLAEEERRTEMGNKAALDAYDKARRLFVEVMHHTTPDDVHELGSIWTHRGMTLLNGAERRDWREACDALEQAITVRRTLPLGEKWLYPWGLAASIMNRAEALTKLGLPENLAEAVAGYDEALTLLMRIPLGEHTGAVRQREVVAWLNRGLALQAQKTEPSIHEALRSFDMAIFLVRRFGDTHHRACRRILACALVNRSSALLDLGRAQAAQAREAAAVALRLVADIEQSDFEAAEAGLKARHSLCRALIWLQGLNDGADEKGHRDRIAEMTDVIDDALKLARHWGEVSGPYFRSTAMEMFRLGCLIFGTMQPHFLADYLLDHLDPERTPDAEVRNRDLHVAAHEAIMRSAQVMQRRHHSWRHATAGGAPNGEQLETNVQILEDLESAAARLASLREHYLGEK